MTLLNKTSNIIRRRPALSRVALKCVPDTHFHITVPRIGRLRIRLRRNRSLWLRPPLSPQWNAANEWYPLAALTALVRPGETVWDVGANIGLYARWLVTLLRAGRVCSFEPMAANLTELRYNLSLGNITDRVEVVPWALSDTNGQVDFQVDDMQSASGAVDAVYGGRACRARAALGLPPLVETVTSRSIDSILEHRDLPAPDVLKIDVEGAERMVLDGGTKFFRAHSPRVVIETHGLEVSKQCLEFLFDHEFHVAACVPAAWHPKRHMRLRRADLARMSGHYDIPHIIASRYAEEIPEMLDSSKI